jgi:hypothetical protein
MYPSEKCTSGRHGRRDRGRASCRGHSSNLDLVQARSARNGSVAELLQGISPEDFVREPPRNRYTSLLGRTAHLAYHYGQAVLAKHK